MPADVKDESSHLSIIFVVGGGFFSVEVVECNIGAKEVDGVTDCGGISDGSSGLKNAGEGGSFEEASEEEVPL